MLGLGLSLLNHLQVFGIPWCGLVWLLAEGVPWPAAPCNGPFPLLGFLMMYMARRELFEQPKEPKQSARLAEQRPQFMDDEAPEFKITSPTEDWFHSNLAYYLIFGSLPSVLGSCMMSVVHHERWRHAAGWSMWGLPAMTVLVRLLDMWERWQGAVRRCYAISDFLAQVTIDGFLFWSLLCIGFVTLLSVSRKWNGAQQ